MKKVSPHIQRFLGMSLAQYQRRGLGCRSGLRSVYGQFDCFFGGRCTCEFQLPTAATGATSQPTGGLACDAKRKVFLVKYSFNSPLSVSSHHSNSAAKRASISFHLQLQLPYFQQFRGLLLPSTHQYLSCEGMCPHFLFSFFLLPHFIPQLLYLGVTVSECVWS